MLRTFIIGASMTIFSTLEYCAVPGLDGEPALPTIDTIEIVVEPPSCFIPPDDFSKCPIM